MPRFDGLAGATVIRRAPPDTAASDAQSSIANASVTTGWRGDLRKTLIDLILALGDVSLDRAVVLADEVTKEIEACFEDSTSGVCLVFGDVDVSSIEEFNDLMQGEPTVRIYGHTLERIVTELGVDLEEVDARTTAPAYVDFTSRPEVIESIEDPWGYYERTIMTKPVRDRPAYVERWVEILGFLGLTAIMGIEDGEKALVHAYAALWDGVYDERFVATGNAIISIVAPARGLGDVHEIIPTGMFRSARLEGESIVLEMEPFGSSLLDDVGTSEKGRREFATSRTITVPADSVVVLMDNGGGSRISALKLLQLTAQSPDNLLEAFEAMLVEGTQEVNALVGDTAEAAGKAVVETLDSAKTAAIQKFLQLAANIENEDHRELAFRAIYALDGLASAILLGVSAVVGVVGGAVKGVVGIATGFASVAGAAIGVIEDLATWIIDGDFEELRARGEDIIVASTNWRPPSRLPSTLGPRTSRLQIPARRPD